MQVLWQCTSQVFLAQAEDFGHHEHHGQHFKDLIPSLPLRLRCHITGVIEDDVSRRLLRLFSPLCMGLVPMTYDHNVQFEKKPTFFWLWFAAWKHLDMIWTRTVMTNAV